MIETGGAIVPCQGQTVSGDAYVVLPGKQGTLLALIDALGHGPPAAEAAAVAVSTIRSCEELSPLAVITICHTALRHHRGVALGVVRIDADGRGVFAGVGNIRALLLPTSSRGNTLVSRPGIVGHSMRRVHEIPFQLPMDGVGVLHSDGISTRIGAITLRQGNLNTQAARLVQEFRHPTDDASVLLFAHAIGARRTTKEHEAVQWM